MRLSSPPPPAQAREKLTYQYQSRDHRVDIQYVMRQLRNFDQDVTSVSEFSSPSEGTVTIELSSLKQDSKPEQQQDQLQKAAQWVSIRLDSLKKQYGAKS